MLTLEQLYKLGDSVGVDIFSGITLPENSPLDRETLVNTIMEKCGLNIPMYGEPLVMYSAIILWSKKNQYTFDHVGKIFNAVYSPIENKDYHEDITVKREHDLTDNTTGAANKHETTGAQTDKTSTHSGTDTTTDEMDTSAYNASDYQDKDKTTSTLDHGETIHDNGTGSTTSMVKSDNINDKKVHEDEGTATTSHQHGNIGVTSNNQLQTQEYEMLKTYNPYNFLADLFENDLTLCIY